MSNEKTALDILKENQHKFTEHEIMLDKISNEIKDTESFLKANHMLDIASEKYYEEGDNRFCFIWVDGKIRVSNYGISPIPFIETKALFRLKYISAMRDFIREICEAIG